MWDYCNADAEKCTFCVPVLNITLAAVVLTDDKVTVDDPDARNPVAVIEGTTAKAGVKLIVIVDPDTL